MNTALEDILINAYANEMEAYLRTHPEDFSEAVVGNGRGEKRSGCAY